MARTVLEVVIAGDSKSLQREMSRASKSVEKFEKSASKSVEKADKSAKKAAKGFGQMSTAAKSAGAALATGVLASGLKKFVSNASDVSEALSKNQRLFGTHADAVEKFAKTSAKSFGTSRRAALEYTGVFGNLFRSLGQSEKAAATNSVALTKLASDMASFNNTSIEDALESIRSGLVGETEPLRKFGVNMNDATLRAEALSKGLIKNTKEALSPQTKALAAQSLIFKQTKQSHGDFARTSGGLANQQKILAAQFDDLTVKVGAGLIPIALSAIKTFKTTASTVAGLVQKFKDGDRTVVVLTTTVAALVAGFVTFKVITTVIAAMKALKVAVIGVNVAMRANPFVLVATAVAALGVALVIAYKKSETFRRIVDGVFTAVKKTVGDAISFILRAFDTYLGGISSVLTAASKLPLVGSKFKAMAESVDTGREKVRGLAKDLDALGEKKVKPRIDTSDIDRAIERAGGLTNALKPGSPLRLTKTPRKDAGDIGGSSAPAGILGGLTPAARGVYGNVARLFGGVRLTSGRRSPSENARVGGAKNSDHLTGNALDLVPAEGWNAQSIARFDRIAAWAKSRGLWVGWRGVPNHGPGNHLHLSYRRKTALGQRNEMGDYGIADLKGLALGQGLSDGSASTAAAVAMAESGGRPGASNRNSDGSIDKGLWQINSVHGALSTFDVKGNARAMAKISSKGRNWSPWVAYKTGAYKQFLARARAAKSSGSKAARKSITMAKMGGSSVVPLNEVEQRKADTLAAMKGYQPSGAADTGGGIPEAPDVYGGGNASLALARLTDTTDDDLAALKGLEATAAQGLAGARAAGDNAGIAAFATDLKGFRDEIKSLTAAMEAVTLEMERARADNERLLKEQWMQRERLSQNQYGVLSNALVEAVNGGIGGALGLGFQSVGFAGGGARY